MIKEYERKTPIYSAPTPGFESLSSLGIHGSTETDAPNTVPSETYGTLGAANAFAARVMELADRLCGPVPTPADEDALYRGDTGEFGRMRQVMRDTREALADANEALNRIERELVG